VFVSGNSPCQIFALKIKGSTETMLLTSWTEYVGYANHAWHKRCEMGNQFISMLWKPSLPFILTCTVIPSILSTHGIECLMGNLCVWDFHESSRLKSVAIFKVSNIDILWVQILDVLSTGSLIPSVCSSLISHTSTLYPTIGTWMFLRFVG
jgi:hypothetical protein